MTKFIRVTMRTGEKWDIPAEKIVIHRANHFAAKVATIEDSEKVFKEEYNNAMSDNTLIKEWARENFKWEDVELYAFKAAPPPRLTREDMEDGWKNGDMEVVNR